MNVMSATSDIIANSVKSAKRLLRVPIVPSVPIVPRVTLEYQLCQVCQESASRVKSAMRAFLYQKCQESSLLVPRGPFVSSVPRECLACQECLDCHECRQ